jgi:hypothetical protein
MSGSSSLGSNGDEDLEDPGRDPKGLNPPRNPLGGGPDQDSGQGKPADSPDIEGQSMMPDSPTENDDRV